MCGPSRVSLVTDWYPHLRGHRTLDHLLKSWEPNLLRHLRDGGYHVAVAGHRGDMFATGVTERALTLWIRAADVHLFEQPTGAYRRKGELQHAKPDRVDKAIDRLHETSDIIPWDADPRFPKSPHGQRTPLPSAP